MTRAHGRETASRALYSDAKSRAYPDAPGTAEKRRAELQVERLSKRFGLRSILADLTFTLSVGDVLAVTGRNGSGKSTLLKILANVAEHTSGSVRWTLDGTPLNDEQFPSYLGYVAPYLQLYGEFAAWEHIELVQQMRGRTFDPQRAAELFELFELTPRRYDSIDTYSSGMAQRVKFICALIHDPPILLLDEPMSNLDTRGIATMRQLVLAQRSNRITVIATNEEEDVKLCTKRLMVGQDAPEDTHGHSA